MDPYPAPMRSSLAALTMEGARSTGTTRSWLGPGVPGYVAALEAHQAEIDRMLAREDR